MRVGIVSPYSFDTPGGVQFHIRDLAEALLEHGHHVAVLAPADPQHTHPDYLTSVGRALPVRFNGSVARLAFGPKVSRITQDWLTNGEFDVVHIHEPFVPSCSLIALRHAKVPIVGTFHSAQERSRVLTLAQPFTRPGFERLNARIAVSEEARKTILEHFDTDAVVIPNGVYVDRYTQAQPHPDWESPDQQSTGQAPTIVFLGRLEEPRKGLDVLLGAVPAVRKRFPGARFLIAGGGSLDYQGEHAESVIPLGPVSEEDKARLLASADIYVAPQTGGESFGIVLVEAMAAGASVVASDLGAFSAVLDGGRAGYLFEVGSPADLARAVEESLTNVAETMRRREHARQWVRHFDWATVVAAVLEVYAMVTETPEITLPPAPGLLGRLVPSVRKNR